MAAIIYSHRRSLHLEQFDDCDEVHKQMGIRLLLILRLAVLLNRSRMDDLPLIPAIKAQDESIVLKFPNDWLDQHPLTSNDLDEEAGYLKKAGFTLTLQ